MLEYNNNFIFRVGYNMTANLKKETLNENSEVQDSRTQLAILIEQGNCNIDFLDSFGHSATYYSLEKGYINLAYYLIVEKKANITNEDSMAILLRYLVFPLDSNEYRLKKQIIQEFKNHSIDYYSKPVPDDVLEMIKNIYPDNWKEYISVY